MSVIKFKIGDQVMTIENNTVREGVIMNFFPDVNPPMLIVKFEDGEVEKVPITTVALKPKTETPGEQTAERTNTPIEASEITITPDEFRDVAVEVAMKLSEGNFTIGMAFAVYSGELSKALFGVESDDE